MAELQIIDQVIKQRNLSLPAPQNHLYKKQKTQTRDLKNVHWKVKRPWLAL